jgi:stress-induced morphogen
MASDLGARVDAGTGPGHALLFGEDQGRYVVAVTEAQAEAVKLTAAEAGVSLRRLGTAGGEELVVEGRLSVSVRDLVVAQESWFPPICRARSWSRQRPPEKHARVSVALIAARRSLSSTGTASPAGHGESFMPMNARDIEKMIKDAIPDAVVSIRDLAGDGDHYAAEIVSESFRGKSRVQQHQMVYQALQGNMGGELHALALQTSAPK